MFWFFLWFKDKCYLHIMQVILSFYFLPHLPPCTHFFGARWFVDNMNWIASSSLTLTSLPLWSGKKYLFRSSDIGEHTIFKLPWVVVKSLERDADKCRLRRILATLFSIINLKNLKHNMLVLQHICLDKLEMLILKLLANINLFLLTS